MIRGWKDTLDNLLIFAGLFLGVVATFVTQSSQSLQQDYTQVTASLLTELVEIQRVAAVNGDINNVPPSTLNVHSTSSPAFGEVLLNGLWLVSLGLTLYTALVAGFIKQWIHYYLVDRTGSPLRKATIRQFRFEGLTRWFVPLIIEVLPMLLHTALLLFSIGLIVFSHLLTGASAITWTLGAIALTAFITYAIANSGPLLSPQCPYKASFTVIGQISYDFCRVAARKGLQAVFRTQKHGWLFRLSPSDPTKIGVTKDGNKAEDSVNLRDLFKSLARRSKFNTAEDSRISQRQNTLMMTIIKELASQSSNPFVSSIAMQSLAALHGYENFDFGTPMEFSFWSSLKQHFQDHFHYTPLTRKINLLASRSCERLARVILLECLFQEEHGKLVRLTDINAVRRNSTQGKFSEEFSLIRRLCTTGWVKDNFRFAGLIMCMVNYGILDKLKDPEAAMTLLAKFLDSPPRVPVLRNWLLSFAATPPVSSLPVDSTVSERFRLELIQSLSTASTPSFQEEFKIRYLQSRLPLPSAYDHQYSRKEGLNVSLFRILPDLISAAIDSQPKSPENIALLTRFLRDFLRYSVRRYEPPNCLQLSFWGESSQFDMIAVEYSRGISASNAADTQTQLNRWRSAETSYLDKLKDVLRWLLHHYTFDTPQDHEDSEVFHSGFDAILYLGEICFATTTDFAAADEGTLVNELIHWIIGLCKQSQSAMENDLVQHRLRGFFASNDGPYGTQALRSCLDVVGSKEHSVIPKGLIKAVLPDIEEHSWRGEYWSSWSDQFDSLFQQFIRQRPSQSSHLDVRNQESQLKDRWCALVTLILYDSFTPRSGDAKLRRQERRETWHLLVQERGSKQLSQGVDEASGWTEEEEVMELKNQHVNSGTTLLRSLWNPRKGNLNGVMGSELEAWHTVKFTPEDFRASFRELLVFSYNFESLPGASFIVGDDTDLRIYLSASLYFETCLSRNDTRMGALDACCELLATEAPPGLPVNLSEEIFDALWELQGENKSRKATQVLSNMFQRILNWDSRITSFQIPYSVALMDRQRTLTGLISFACCMVAQRDYSQRHRWKELVSDWEKLLSSESKLCKSKLGGNNIDDKAEEVILKDLLVLLSDVKGTGKRFLWRYPKRQTNENLANTDDTNTNALDGILHTYRGAMKLSNRVLRGFAGLARQPTSDSRSSARSHGFEV